MKIQSFVDFLERRFADHIASHTTFEPNAGDFTPLPAELQPDIKEALVAQGFEQLYAHQREAFEAIGQQQDTVLVSRTASGKTLSFFLPILDDYVRADAPFSVALLYPTKALSRDQEGRWADCWPPAAWTYGWVRLTVIRHGKNEPGFKAPPIS